MWRSRWAKKVEPRFDGRSIVGVVAANLAGFAGTVLMRSGQGAGLVQSFADGFLAWAVLVVASLGYWAHWIGSQKKRNFPVWLEIVAGVLIVALHATAVLVILQTRATLLALV